MKHIVLVIGNYKNGGVAMRSTNLANQFAKAGYRCTLLVTKEISDNVFFNQHENVELVSLKDYASAHIKESDVSSAIKKTEKKIKRIKRLRAVIGFFPAIDKKLRQEVKKLRTKMILLPYAVRNPDSLYIAFGAECYTYAFCATHGLKSKIIYAERNAPELEFPVDEKEKANIFRMLSSAGFIVVQTEDEKQFFENCFNNTVVINNPVKENLPTPFGGERRKVIVNFCRIAKQKNIPLMINAFLEFHKTHPDYTLEIYGNTVEKREDELKQEYIEMISALNATDFIKILPPRADIHAIIRDCSMFVSSSDYEGLSNSMLEALAIGMPCVCTDCLGGGAREMITDGENGLLVPMNDVTSLAEAMKKMADDKEFAKKCSENAAKVRKTHNVETISARWLDVIEKLI